MKNQIVVIAGPSGSGKNSILEGVMERCPSFEKLVTAATRPIREGEKNGFDHIFITNEEFLAGIDSGDIPEHQYRADRDIYYGVHLPGLMKQKETGRPIISEIQIIGAKYLRKNHGAITFFIMPDSIDELERRIRGRGELPEEEIQSRLNIAKHEIEHEGPWYDHVITNTNGKLENAINSVLEILQKEGFDCSV